MSLRRLFLGLIFLAFFAQRLSASQEIELSSAEKQWLAAHPSITLGIAEDWEPLVIKGKNGFLWGIAPEMISMINQKLGSRITLITGAWHEILSQAEKKEIDGLAASALLKERENHFAFSVPYWTLYKLVFAGASNSLKISSLSELSGKKVGVQKGIAYDKKALSFFPAIQIVEKENFQDLITALQKNELDAFVGDENHIRIMKALESNQIKPLYLIDNPPLQLVFSIRKDWAPLVFILNKAIASLTQREKEALLEKWRMNTLSVMRGPRNDRFSLSETEQAWLAENPRIKIAPDPFFPPIEFFDAAGKYSGIAADYMEIIQDRLNIRFEVVRSKSWDEVLERARKKQVDILPAAANTPERREFLSYSEPHLVFPGVIIASTKSEERLSLEKLKGKKIGVVSGYLWQELIKKDYPDYEIIPVPDKKTGLKEVSLGNIDVLIATLPVAVYYIEKEGISNLRVAGETGYYTRLSLGVRKDWPILSGILNKALSSISPKTKKNIYQKWVYIKSGSLLESKEFWGILTLVILGAGVVLLLVLFWNFILKRQVAQKTEELERELLQRSLTEAQLRVSEGQNRALLEAFPDKIFRIRQDGLILDYKGPEEHLALPLEQIVGTNLMETPLPDDVKKESLSLYREVIETGRMKVFEYQLIFPDGVNQFEARIVKSGPDEIISIVRNMTSEKKIQNMLIQNEKMISIGRLAAGMAHEINNPLGVVLQGSQNTLRRLSPEIKKNQEAAAALGISLEQIMTYLKERKILTYLEGMQTAGKRAADIVQNMLSFARNSNARKEHADIRALIDTTLELISNDYNMASRYDFKKIKVNKIYEKNLPLLPCIVNELEQVLLNLIKNAFQAMEKNQEKPPQLEISVSATRKKMDIVISDNGPGIAPDIQKRIFEPFFTTKEAGQGTGLGLSVSYYIITENHQGKLWMTSSSEKGTVFTIQLPLD